jgi:hypothetical protein
VKNSTCLPSSLHRNENISHYFLEKSVVIGRWLMEGLSSPVQKGQKIATTSKLKRAATFLFHQATAF